MHEAFSTDSERGKTEKAMLWSCGLHLPLEANLWPSIQCYLCLSLMLVSLKEDSVSTHLVL